MTHKNRKKCTFFMFWSAGCSLLRAEGFSFSLGVLFRGLGISKWQFLIKEIKIQFPAVIFYFILGLKPWIRIQDPDPESGSAIRKNAGSGSVSGSALNQCGSETLLWRPHTVGAIHLGHRHRWGQPPGMCTLKSPRIGEPSAQVGPGSRYVHP